MQHVPRNGPAPCGSHTHLRPLLLGTYASSSHHPSTHLTNTLTILHQSYDMGKKLVYALTPSRTSQSLTIPELAFAGFFSAIPTTLVAGPAERIKVVLQVQGQGGKAQYSGPAAVVRGLYKEGGLKSIFRGTGATLARDGPGSAA